MCAALVAVHHSVCQGQTRTVAEVGAGVHLESECTNPEDPAQPGGISFCIREHEHSSGLLCPGFA